MGTVECFRQAFSFLYRIILLVVNMGRGYPDNSTGLILVDLTVSVQRWICHEDQRATCWHDPFPQPWEGLGRVFTWPCVLYKICKSRYFNCSLSCCCLFLLWLLPSHFLCPVELEWHWQFGDLVKGKLLRRYTEYELSMIDFVVHSSCWLCRFNKGHYVKVQWLYLGMNMSCGAGSRPMRETS